MLNYSEWRRGAKGDTRIDVGEGNLDLERRQMQDREQTGGFLEEPAAGCLPDKLLNSRFGLTDKQVFLQSGNPTVEFELGAAIVTLGGLGHYLNDHSGVEEDIVVFELGLAAND